MYYMTNDFLYFYVNGPLQLPESEGLLVLPRISPREPLNLMYVFKMFNSLALAGTTNFKTVPTSARFECVIVTKIEVAL